MTIEEFVKCLEIFPEETVIDNVTLEDYGSDRGDYYQFYIGQKGYNDISVVRVKDIVSLIKTKVIGKEFDGYKGGEYLMDWNTDIRLGVYGGNGYDIDGIIVKYDYTHGVTVSVKPETTLRY